MANARPYKVDGEVGRFEFTTHRVLKEGEVVYDSGRELFGELGAKEYYRTIGFKEIAMIYGDTEASYRKTARLINRMRYQEQGGTPYRTLQETTEREGAELIDFMSERSKRILRREGFSEEGIYEGPDKGYVDKAVEVASEQVSKAAQKIGEGFDMDEILRNPVCYEDPRSTVNVTIDDVGVKGQKDKRGKLKESEGSKRKYVHNTVVHIEKEGESYTLNGHGIKQVLSFLTAFILDNALIGNRIQFFTDGHKTLNETILKWFVWYKNIGIILDWYHLEKKCKEQLSLAMKGRFFRNELLEQLLPLLWHGLTDKAVALIKETDADVIKDRAAIEKLLTYLDRNKPCIPCYAIRKELGLRNSSAIGEKMNDLIVSERQKHNGMSWSKPGSVALASITSLKRNNEWRMWFEKGELEYKLVA